MTVKDLENAVSHIDDDLVAEALPEGFGRTQKGAKRSGQEGTAQDNPAQGAKRSRLRPVWIAAACLAAAVLGFLVWPRSNDRTPIEKLLWPQWSGSTPKAHAYALAEAQYPSMTDGKDYYISSMEEYWALSPEERMAFDSNWEKAKEQNAQSASFRGNGVSIKPFLQKAMVAALSGAGEDNALSAPLNLYFALAMLSEAANGETRQEILDVLGADSAEALREQARKIWLANYYDNGYVQCILGSSCWLSDSLNYKKDCVERLRDCYYASVFRGEMGSEKYDVAFREWINAQTGSLLKDSVSGLSLSKETVLDLVSTFYFQDKWREGFQSAKNTQGTFHGAAGDVPAEFMHQTDYNGQYYYGEHFSAYGKWLEDSYAVMFFILPDEGVSMDELLQDPQLQAFLTNDSAAPSTRVKVNLTLPKFDIAQDQDLAEAVRQMGVQKVFDPLGADFGNLTDDSAAWVSTIQQGARIIVDEQGVKAAAYINVPLLGGAMAPAEEQVDFVLDRPFLFVLRSQDKLPLLAGIVNQP